VALRKLTGFDTVFKALSGCCRAQSAAAVPVRLVRVSDQQFTHLNDMLRDACYILDLEKVRRCTSTRTAAQRDVHRLDEPIIVVTTGLVELLDEEEMRRSSATRWATRCPATPCTARSCCS